MAESSCLLDRAKGSASRVVFQDEPCWGNVDYEDQQPVGLDIVTETLRNQINRIQSQIIRSSRQRRKSQQGNQRPGGDVNGEFQPQSWSKLMRHALSRSRDVDTAGSDPYTHRYNGGVDLDDGLTMEKRFGFRDSDDVILQYRGCRINQFYFTVPTEGIITCRAGILAKREVQVFDDVAVETDEASIEVVRAAQYAIDNDGWTSFHCSLEIDGDPIVTVKSLDWLLSNNMDAEAFALNGKPYRADLTEDERGMNGNMVAFFTRDVFDTFYPAYLDNIDIGLRILLSRGTQSLEIFHPKVNLGGDMTPVIAGKTPLDIPMTWEAHEDDDTGHDVEVTLINHEPSLATAA